MGVWECGRLDVWMGRTCRSGGLEGGGVVEEGVELVNARGGEEGLAEEVGGGQVAEVLRGVLAEQDQAEAGAVEVEVEREVAAHEGDDLVHRDGGGVLAGEDPGVADG